jgi:hypothetical protein
MTTVVKLSSNHYQVGDDDAPTNPALETIQAVIGTVRQLHRTSNDTDATFDTVPEALTLFEPRLLFALTLPLRQATCLWNRKLLDARLPRVPATRALPHKTTHP